MYSTSEFRNAALGAEHRGSEPMGNGWEGELERGGELGHGDPAGQHTHRGPLGALLSQRALWGEIGNAEVPTPSITVTSPSHQSPHSPPHLGDQGDLTSQPDQEDPGKGTLGSALMGFSPITQTSPRHLSVHSKECLKSYTDSQLF